MTLPQEVKYIWRAPWNWSKVLYLLTRYIPFITVSLALRSEFPPHWLAHLPIHFSFLDETWHISCTPRCDRLTPRAMIRSKRTSTLIPAWFSRPLLTSPYPLDQFSWDPSPESCKRTLHAICCGCLLFHFAAFFV